MQAVQQHAADSWQWHLANAIRDPGTLGATLGLELEEVPVDFPLLVPRPYLERIEPNNPDDPLLRQVLPVAAELNSAPGYLLDPLQEQSQHSGALSKYAGRILAVATGACAINCRYCFRRHFPYGERQLASRDWDTLLDSIEADPSATELILSGGDPLVLPDRALERILRRAGTIPQLRSLRVHTRLPVVIPQRVTDRLLALFSDCPVPVTVVVHSNHAREIDEQVAGAFQRLGEHVQLLNQSVLLAGVNDSAEALAALSWRLHASGVLPYYLHLLDPVQGAAHFEVDTALGKTLIAALRSRLPGFLVPRLAREEPGAAAKTVLA